MNRGDIYFVSLDPTSGHEQQGLRPVVIVSPDAFNAATGVPIVCPITNGGAFAQRNGFAVPVTNANVTGAVRCDQPRAMDIAARRGRHHGQMPADVMADVLARLATLFT